MEPESVPCPLSEAEGKEVSASEERELSDAYMRVRELVKSFDTAPGGIDRFEVTEAAIRKLLRTKEVLRLIVNALPSNKDWLDPALEAEARDLLEP